MTHIHARKRALPRHVKQELPKYDIMRQALHTYYQVIPLDCIFVDPVNGVVLYKNQESGGWCSVAERILYQYTDKGDDGDMHEVKKLDEWLKDLGFIWVDGREQLTKGVLNAPGAHQVIHQLLMEGAITYVGR